MSISTVEVSVRGVRVPGAYGGSAGRAEAVVFMRGNPGPAEDWRELLTPAGGLGRAVAPDMPGYGRAGKPKNFSREYIRGLRGQTVVVIGGSSGIGSRRPGWPAPKEQASS